MPLGLEKLWTSWFHRTSRQSWNFRRSHHRRAWPQTPDTLVREAIVEVAQIIPMELVEQIVDVPSFGRHEEVVQCAPQEPVEQLVKPQHHQETGEAIQLPIAVAQIVVLPVPQIKERIAKVFQRVPGDTDHAEILEANQPVSRTGCESWTRTSLPC